MVTKKDCKEIIYVWNGFTNGLPVFENWFLHKNFLKTKGTQIYIDFENMTPEEIQTALEEWMYHGEEGTHEVKWGTRNGKQRFKTIAGGEVGIGGKAYQSGKGREIIDDIILPFEIREDYKTDEIEPIKSYAVLNRIKATFENRWDIVDASLSKEEGISKIKGDVLESIESQREIIKERTDQVSFFKSFYQDQMDSATSENELFSIVTEAEDKADELGIENTREFSGKSFETNINRLSEF